NSIAIAETERRCRLILLGCDGIVNGNLASSIGYVYAMSRKVNRKSVTAAPCRHVFNNGVLVRGILMYHGHRARLAVSSVDTLQRRVVTCEVHARADGKRSDQLAGVGVQHHELLIPA